MSAVLNFHDLAVLEKMQNTTEADDAVFSNVPSNLFIYGLISRRPDGQITVTKAGQRLIFQRQCYVGLLALKDYSSHKLSDNVERWLSAAAFIRSKHGEGSLVTRRGNIWLSSFQAQQVVDVLELSAEDFKRRRNGGHLT